MTKKPLFLIALAACGVVLAAATQNAPGQLPRFLGGVDLVVIDASVLDRNRKPVRGLTAEDFVLLEGGKPQPIVAFSAIDIPDAPALDAAAAPWMRDVAPDVRRNLDDASHRIVLIVLDDASPTPAWASGLARQVGQAVIEKLGPDDLALVAFTSDKRRGQEFTHDRARLRTAVNAFTANTDAKSMNAAGFEKYANESLSAQAMLAPRLVAQTLRGMAEGLADLPQRRKAMVVISTLGLDLSKLVPRLVMSDGDDSSAMLSTELYEVRQFLAAAQRSNVNVYGIDPRGLTTPDFPTGAFSGTSTYIHDPSQDARDFLNVISLNTGGFPIVSTNDPEPGIQQMFRENGSYYLLGYAPANPRTDGRFRPIQLKVKNRPDVQVRVRSGYYEPERPGRKKDPAPAAAWSSVAGTVAKSDLVMQVAGAAFGVASQARAAVALTLGIELPAPADRAIDSVDLVVVALDANSGKQVASERSRARVTLRAAPGGGQAFYEVLARIDLKPGRYQVRLGASSSLSGKSGSVYADLDVPDFSSSRGALSGLVLSMKPGPVSAPGNRFAGLLPIVPTTLREFVAGDQVTAFLRVYDGGKDAPGPVPITARITDSEGRIVFRTARSVTLVPVGDLRAADYLLMLPIERLLPGPHLLTIEAKVGKDVLRRDARFSAR